MLLRKLVVVGLVGFVTLAASIATAEDADGPSASFVDGVNLADPTSAFSDRFELSVSPGREARFAAFSPDQTRERTRGGNRDYELSVVAPAGNGVDVSFAQRGGVGFNEQGDVERESRASEVRVGRGLRMREDEPALGSRWYLFAASEDEALVWHPGIRNELGIASSGFAIQDRVEIGDVQAGVTYEANGWQTSLAYVEREISARSGSRTYNQDERFVGLTVTMRH
jgi:hypothetical protein